MNEPLVFHSDQIHDQPAISLVAALKRGDLFQIVLKDESNLDLAHLHALWEGRVLSLLDPASQGHLILTGAGTAGSVEVDRTWNMQLNEDFNDVTTMLLLEELARSAEQIAITNRPH